MLENTITKQNKVAIALKDLYASFNKVQIDAHLPLEEATLKTMTKAESHDDTAAWSNKLVMFLQS